MANKTNDKKKRTPESKNAKKNIQGKKVLKQPKQQTQKKPLRVEIIKDSAKLKSLNNEKLISDNYNSSINILFIDVEKDWRGGHSQLAHLLERLTEKKCKIYLVCRDGGALWNWAERIGGFILIDYRVSPSFMLGLLKLIREEKIDIIHAQSSRSHDVALTLKIFRPEVKLIVSRRIDFHRRGGLYNRWKYRTQLIDLWIAVSQNVKNVLIQDGVKPDRIKVIHDGVDNGNWRNSGRMLPFDDRRTLTRESLNYQIHELIKERRFKKDVVTMAFQGETSVLHHEPNPGFVLHDTDFLFGIISALIEQKDHETLIRAFSLAKSQQSNLKLLIVGDGKLWSKLEKLISDLELNPSVHMLGFRTDVDALMNLFDGFVLSSYLDGLGSSLIDAMAAGLPIVCTDAGGFPEIIKNGRNGIMVPKKNPQALADAMVALSRDKRLRVQMSKNNLKDAIKFDADLMTGQTWDVYTGLLQSKL